MHTILKKENTPFGSFFHPRLVVLCQSLVNYPKNKQDKTLSLKPTTISYLYL